MTHRCKNRSFIVPCLPIAMIYSVDPYDPSFTMTSSGLNCKNVAPLIISKLRDTTNSLNISIDATKSNTSNARLFGPGSLLITIVFSGPTNALFKPLSVGTSFVALCTIYKRFLTSSGKASNVARGV